GATELEEAAVAMARDQLVQLEFVVGVEAAGSGRHLAAQQAIRPDDSVEIAAGKRLVDHQQVVAHVVEPVRVASLHHAGDVATRAQLLVEDPVAHLLGRLDLRRRTGQAYLERADAPERQAVDHGLAKSHRTCNKTSFYAGPLRLELCAAHRESPAVTSPG